MKVDNLVCGVGGATLGLDGTRYSYFPVSRNEMILK